jgi:hypothetical protein
LCGVTKILTSRYAVGSHFLKVYVGLKRHSVALTVTKIPVDVRSVIGFSVAALASAVTDLYAIFIL